MGFGIEILFILVLSVLLLGPKRMPAILRHISRAKAQLEHATRHLQATLDAEAGGQRDDEQALSNPAAAGEL